LAGRDFRITLVACEVGGEVEHVEVHLRGGRGERDVS
jgi:hypothetical protein